jgi:outer membrane protein TolC
MNEELQLKMKNEKRKTQNEEPSYLSFCIFRFSVFIFSCSCLPGCFDSAGTGGTGEIVVPTKTLREINAFDPAKAPASQPTSKPTTPPAQVDLGIEQCRQFALQNNLDLRVDLLNPTIAKESLSENEARYEALFVANSSYSVTDAATATQLANSQAKDLHADAGVQIPLRTGGTINVTVPFERFETNNKFSTLNPAYTANLQASISMPLLRGAGLYYNTQAIRIAFYEYQASQAATKLEVIRVLADVDRAYWRLYAARQELIVRKKQHDLAAMQLDRARRQVKAQIAAEVEIVRAESGVADTIEQIITSENAVRDRQRELKRLLNQPDLGVDTDTIIVPISPPNAAQYKLDAQKLIAAALRDRMELLETELHIAEETANVRVARSDLLPLVTFQYQYQQNGLGKTAGDAFTLLERNRFADHMVGVHLEVPIGNEAARSRLRASLARRLQQLATKEQRNVQIEQEVLNALDSLDLTWQRILAAQKRVILNARLVDAETRQFDLGLRTSTEVLDAQTKLADARSSEILALTDYQIAQVDIAFATGNVLGAARVAWQPTAASTKR